MLTIALPKGRIADETLKIFTQIFGNEFKFDNRKLILEQDGFRFLLVRNQDVPTYVLYGSADLGICGEDLLIESDAAVTKLLDLGIGKCTIALGMRKGERLDLTRSHIRVATKMVNITKQYFAKKAMAAQVIKLYGSIELAPLVGIVDAIVDIVETGETMRENNLEPVETIMHSSARLFANQNSYIEKKNEILQLRQRIADVIK